MVVLTKKTQKEEAFTIVELLIVIVVIAILASVTVVAYTGIQQRANNSKVASTVASYIRLLELYKASEGQYPLTGNGDNPVCLGKPEDYPATSTYQAGWCATWVFNGDTDAYHETSEDFNDALATVTSSVPSGESSDIATATAPNGWNTTDVHYRGILYQNLYDSDTNGYGEQGFIHYFLNGTQDCTQGEAFAYEGITECVVSLGGAEIGESDWGAKGGEGNLAYE